MLADNKFINEIDARIASRSLLKHPFYQAWTAGTLPMAALQDYAAQYYHHVAAFPTYLSAVHSQLDDQATRLMLLQNLRDEEAGEPNHPQLWLQFAGALGLGENEVQTAALEPETGRLIATFRTICRQRPPAAGIASLYAYESQIPAVAEAKIDGLQRFYGIADAKGLAYFNVHVEADREHSAVERRLLEESVTDENFSIAAGAVDETLEALWDMLSGVCRRKGIACN